MLQTLKNGLWAVAEQGNLFPERIRTAIELMNRNKDRVAFAVMGLLIAVSVLFISKKCGATRVVLTKLGVLDPKDLSDEDVIERNHNRAKYMVRESAKLIASALEKRESAPIEAYEQALQAAVLARTAKEIHDDASRLSEELGVDFWEYLAYTSTVVQELRSNMLAKT